MNYCVIDCETRSRAELKDVGAWNYSKHPTTELLCVSAWDSLSQSMRTWEVDPFGEAPGWFWQLVEEMDVWVAHNAFFEIAIWKNLITPRFGVPLPDLHQWQDTKAIALNWALPASLAGASAVLGREEKDKTGHKLMLKMCKPKPVKQRKKSLYHWTNEDFDRLVKYCEQDVIATKAILDDLGALQKIERPIFELDKKINHKGFSIDVELVDAAAKMARGVLENAKKELVNITNGYIQTPNQHARFKKFALTHGVRMHSTDKESVIALLKKDRIPSIIRRVFEIRQLLGKSSVAKYEKAAYSVDRDDNKIRDSFCYHKASTGRWAGQGFQPQNLPARGLKLDEHQIELAIEAIKQDNVSVVSSFGPVMHVLSTVIRSTIIAPKGKKFVAADFASVEARGVLWMAKEIAAMKLIRQGVDIYKEMASTIFNVPISEVTAFQRFVGKTAILGLGYGMGVDLFSERADVDIMIAKKAVDSYRSRFAGVPKIWRAMEMAFKNAILTCRPQKTCGVTFYPKKPRVIACRLPSGRDIHYWDCKIDHDNTISYGTVFGASGKWIRTTTWGGKILENVMQALCSDLLRFSMLMLQSSNWSIAMTVHDEIVCETPDREEYNVDGMIEIITKLPSWAEGFPLAAEGWEGKRFRK